MLTCAMALLSLPSAASAQERTELVFEETSTGEELDAAVWEVTGEANCRGTDSC